MIWLGHRRWKLCWLRPCWECDQLLNLRDRSRALRWLRQFQTDPLDIAALRALLSQRDGAALWRLEDAEVIRLVAEKLVIGQLQACAIVQPRVLITTIPEEPPAPELPLTKKFVATSEPPRVIEPPVFPDEADLVAIAEAQKEAARLGIPFCEECVRE